VADPQQLRVSDEQRERAAQALREHFAAGRISEDELDDRVQAAYDAKTEAELDKQLSDLPKLPATPQQQKAELVERRRHLQRRLIQETAGGFGLFLVCTVIWAASGASGSFWPIWVAIFPVIALVRNGWMLYGPDPQLDRIERELDRQRDRGPRRQVRQQRRDDRSLRRGDRWRS
jgi:hypothetical protein